MKDLTDQQLLRDYAERRSEAAFTELVRRHINLVHSAAFRMTGEAHSAKDVAQGVFVALAQSATRLTRHPVLCGWLHTTARNLAAKTIRTDVRRRRHEREVATMNELLSATPEAPWEEIAPRLDAALGKLSESDRDAVMLRYFEKKSAPEMAAVLGISDEAAQKRVSRAVERLREIFAKHGVRVGASGLAVAMSANAVQAAPAGLAVAISAAALAGTAASTVTPTIVAATTKTIAMTTLQKTLVTSAVAVLAGVGVYEARHAAQLRDQVQTLQQQQAPLTNDIAKLRAETERLSNLVAEAKYQTRLTEAQFSELLRLRGQVGQVRVAMQELTRAKAAVEQRNAAMPAYFTNAMAQGMNFAMKYRKKELADKVARMREMLHLSEDQAAAISDVMLRRIDEESRVTLEALTSGGQRLTPAMNNPISEDDEVTALLTPEQAAGYEDFKQAERVISAEKRADAEVKSMTDELSLSQDQQEQIRHLLVQNSLYPSSFDVAASAQAVAQARRSRDYATVIELQIKALHQNLEDKLDLFEGVLTREQLQDYQHGQLDRLDMQESALRILLPQTSSAPAVLSK